MIQPAVRCCFIRGNLGALNQRRVGIVGTRSATAAGRYMASHISFDLAEQGIATVSGLARGIDAWAHKGVSVAYSRASDRSRLGIPIGVVHVAVALALRVGVQPQFSGDRLAQS